MDFYIKISDVFTDKEEVLNEINFWINEHIDFLLLWESVYNKELEDSDFENLTLDKWINYDIRSFKYVNDECAFHPQILLAFIIDEPIYRMKFLASIFELKDTEIMKIIQGTFDFEEKNNK